MKSQKYWCWFLLAACVSPAAADVTQEALCRIPADRTPQFHLLTNRDLTKVAAMDVWGEEKKWYVCLNSKVWEFYTALDADSAQFSPDGTHLSLLAQHGGDWFLVTDNADARPLGKDPCHVRTTPEIPENLQLSGHQPPRIMTQGAAVASLDSNPRRRPTGKPCVKELRVTVNLR